MIKPFERSATRMRARGHGCAWFLVLACAAGTAAAQPYGDRSYGDRESDNVKYAWADVLRVDPVYERVRTRTPRERCEEVTYPRHDGGTTTGTVLGAIVGGVLGNTVGKGDGRRAATVAGAVVGGAVGHGIASERRDYAYPAPRCDVVDEISEEQRLVGYDVQYRYRGDVYGSRLGFDPGDRVRVRVSVEPAE
jgi:uncharacterized protein YcfJ